MDQNNNPIETIVIKQIHDKEYTEREPIERNSKKEYELLKQIYDSYQESPAVKPIDLFNSNLILKYYPQTLEQLLYNNQVFMQTYIKLSMTRILLYQLYQIHKINISHRDIKTSNILIDRFGIPLYTDFGQSYQPTYNNTGTLIYRSPELLFGYTQENQHQITKLQDVWALGLVIYQLFTKQLLFVGKGEIHLISQISQLYNLSTIEGLCNYENVKLFSNNFVQNNRFQEKLKTNISNQFILDLLFDMIQFDFNKRLQMDQIIQKYNINEHVIYNDKIILKQFFQQFQFE